MAAAKKELLKAIMGGGKGPAPGPGPAGGKGPVLAIGAELEPEDPVAAEDDEAIFQDALAQFFPGMTEEEYLQFHRVANAKLGE